MRGGGAALHEALLAEVRRVRRDQQLTPWGTHDVTNAHVSANSPRGRRASAHNAPCACVCVCVVQCAVCVEWLAQGGCPPACAGAGQGGEQAQAQGGGQGGEQAQGGGQEQTYPALAQGAHAWVYLRVCVCRGASVHV